MKIVMVGSGNTATVLCVLLKKGGHEIVQVVSRSMENAQALASLYNARYDVLTASNFAEADIYILALSDVALEHLDKITALKDKFIVHTAGAISINVLKELSQMNGVLYPLQTLSKFSENIPEIPFLVDGNNQESLHRVIGLAKTLSPNVSEANDTERLNYHVAAVFVGNFANHMFALGELFCKKERLEFKTLLPLINEVNARVNSHSPFLTQTGPAIRDDIFTLNRHLQALSSHPELKYVYLKLSESIIKAHGKR
ncbi:MAG: Rossmann-like and DUF2520 domain-containing protein [Ginsengibacter sp.]